VSSGVITTSTRGRCAGRDWRSPERGFAARIRVAARFSISGLGLGCRLLDLFQGELKLIGVEPL
jgi:hypothetical protein